MKLTYAELSTILAALRYVQNEFADYERDPDNPFLNSFRDCMPDHFMDCEPCDSEGINALCEKLAFEAEIEKRSDDEGH
jgi:hypothetical protein